MHLAECWLLNISANIASYLPVLTSGGLEVLILESADRIWSRVPHTKTRKTLHTNMCPENFNLIVAERILCWHQQKFRECWWLFGRTAYFATSACRQPLPTFPLTWSARATGSCTTGSRARMWYMHDGAPAHLSRDVRGVLRNNCHDRGIGTGGPTAWPPRSAADLNPPDFYMWRRLNAATKKHFIVDICQTIRNCRDIFARMWRSMRRRVEVYSLSHWGHFEHLLCIYSFSTNSHIKFFRTHVDMDSFVVCYVEIVHKNLFTLSSHTLCIELEAGDEFEVKPWLDGRKERNRNKEGATTWMVKREEMKNIWRPDCPKKGITWSSPDEAVSPCYSSFHHCSIRIYDHPLTCDSPDQAAH
jgi:hypothetical protein